VVNDCPRSQCRRRQNRAVLIRQHNRRTLPKIGVTRFCQCSGSGRPARAAGGRGRGNRDSRSGARPDNQQRRKPEIDGTRDKATRALQSPISTYQESRRSRHRYL
jgi:hypothetical protein